MLETYSIFQGPRTKCHASKLMLLLLLLLFVLFNWVFGVFGVFAAAAPLRPTGSPGPIGGAAELSADRKQKNHIHSYNTYTWILMCGSGSMSGVVGGCLKLNISGEDRAVRLLANRWQIIKMRGNDMERPKHHQVVIYIYT